MFLIGKCCLLDSDCFTFPSRSAKAEFYICSSKHDTESEYVKIYTQIMHIHTMKHSDLDPFFIGKMALFTYQERCGI